MKGSLSWHLGSITATPELLFAGVEFKNTLAYHRRSEKPLGHLEAVTDKCAVLTF